MHMRSFGMRLALVTLMVLPLVSCQYVDQLQALREIKDAHMEYQRGNYEVAVELYEGVLAKDPSMTDAYFYLANSYDLPMVRHRRRRPRFRARSG